MNTLFQATLSLKKKEWHVRFTTVPFKSKSGKVLNYDNFFISFLA